MNLVKKIVIVTLFFVYYTAYTQTPEVYTSAEIYLQLKKLNVLGSVLYIAAHPDDENNSLLPYLSKEKLYRTGYLSLTRGDGGQNLIGNEQGIELGLIRTQELLAARRIDGCEQFFSRAYEFGFSKTWNETLKIWDKEKVLADVVWVIRNFKPDVIITRFPGDERAGHGHHAASSILANEAFIAAADASKFPEQLKYTQPWQAKRIVWNTYNFGANNTTGEDQLKIDIGNYNALIGKSYGELGAEARTMHKSQGEGRTKRRGPLFEYFATTGGDTAHNSLMDNVDASWNRISKANGIEESIDTIIQHYNFEHPEYSVKPLIELYRNIQKLGNSGYWQNQKLNEVANLILQCSGTYIEAVTDKEYVVPGEKANATLYINKRNESIVQLEHITLSSDGENLLIDSTFNIDTQQGKNVSVSKQFDVPSTKKFSQPYWLKSPMQKGLFTVDEQRKIGDGESDAPYTASFTFKTSDISFVIKRPLQYKYTDPVRGEVYQPINVITPLVVAISPDVILTNVQTENKKAIDQNIQVQYKSNFASKQTQVTIYLKQDSFVVFSKDTIIDFETGNIYNFSLPIQTFYKKDKGHNVYAEIVLTKDSHKYTYSHYLRTIKYDHIPAINYFYKDNINVVDEPIKTVGKTIGYINGAGDKVPDALLALGFDVKYLNEKDITEGSLKKFDAIIAGIRAYDMNEWLTDKNSILSNYVSNGGNLIVQYIRSNTIANKKIKAGPYNFTTNTKSRITEEDAKVNFLLPQHAALNYPNKIANKDFDGWIQERSTYQADAMDEHFEKLLSMKDSGDATESNGSLIIAKYGKGNCVYASLVFFRQLPAGVGGAYKLMANLIALPKNK